MLERKIIFAICVCLAFLGGLYFYSGSSAGQDVASLPTGLKNGERIAHRDDGTILSRVNYADGLKHGDSYLYYDDGKTVQLKMPYVHGKRHGTSVKYFQNGKIYARTPYDNDELHGWRKLYYRNGQLKAEIPYGYGLPGTGLREFYKSGKPKKMPAIEYSQLEHYMLLTTSEPCEDARFFIGELVMNTFYDEKDRDLKLLQTSNKGFVVNLKVFTPSYLAMQDVICFCETAQGNPLVLKKRIKL